MMFGSRETVDPRLIVVKLFMKNFKVHGHSTSTSRTKGQKQTDGRLAIRYDTIAESLTWTRKLSI